jgi:hypothetical protein
MRAMEVEHMVAPPPGYRSAVTAITVGHIGEPVSPTRTAAVRAVCLGKNDAKMKRKKEITQETSRTS